MNGPVAWRLPLAMQFIFIAILYSTVPWLPESPRWLVAKERHEEAEQILADIEGTETELSEIKWAANYEKEHNIRVLDLLRGKKGADGGTVRTSMRSAPDTRRVLMLSLCLSLLCGGSFSA